MPQNGEDCESAHTLVRNDLGYARLNADYFGLKNIKPDKLPPVGLGSVFEVPQSSLQIDQACVSRGGAVRANSSPDIRDSCASRKSSDVCGFRPEHCTCAMLLGPSDACSVETSVASYEPLQMRDVCGLRPDA